MANASKWIAVGFVLAFGASQGFAQQAVKVAQNDATSCRKEVKDYLATLNLLRESAGSHVGDQVAGAFLSEAEVDKIVQLQGHCAAAHQLREKRIKR